MARRSCVVDPTRASVDVGPVDRKRRHRLRQRLLASGHVLLAGEPLHLGRERSAGLLELGLQRDLVKAAPLTRDLLPQARERLLSATVHEHAADVVEELIADGATDRPVAQALGGLEDLLDPHLLGASLAQPCEVLRRIGQAVGVIDPQAADHSFAHQREHQPVGLLEHRRVLLAHADQIIDVEEPPVGSGDGVDIEVAFTQLGVRPVAVVLVGGHVIGHDVEHHAHARVVGGPGQAAQPRLTAERVGDPRRVDHVVAMGGARAGLQRGREVQM